MLQEALVSKRSIQETIFFLVIRLLPLGVATADHLPPTRPITRLLFRDNNHFMSSFTTSTNMLCGLPIFLQHSSSVFNILCPIYLVSLLCTCSNHLSHVSLALSPNCSRKDEHGCLFFLFLFFKKPKIQSEKSQESFRQATSKDKAPCLISLVYKS